MDDRKLIYADDVIRWIKIECNPYGKPTLDFESGKKVIEYLERMPSAQPEIIYCKDCVKHNKGHGYYLDGTVIGIKDCCPLVEIRGMAQGHEFDYQYCAYAERRQDGTRD